MSGSFPGSSIEMVCAAPANNAATLGLESEIRSTTNPGAMRLKTPSMIPKMRVSVQTNTVRFIFVDKRFLQNPSARSSCHLGSPYEHAKLSQNHLSKGVPLHKSF
mmetsp:Transcript_32142/g.77712  ORF Transcript_32142/g.77712 Transcript_32142/m.77712 type:complete len:105 (-) Transcript_32142:693-1007(-)